MKKWFIFLFAAVFSVSLFMAGCNKDNGAEKTSAETAQTESADKGSDRAAADKVEESADAADEAAIEEAAEEVEDGIEEAAETEYTIEVLCNKVLEETQVIANGAMDEAALKQAMDNCMMADDGYAGMDKGQAAIGAMVEHYMTACGELSGMEFMNCYMDESMAAGEAAMKEMQ